MSDLIDYIKLMKGHALNSNISIYELATNLLYVVVDSLNIKNKMNEPLFLNKSRISDFMNRKSRLPIAITSELSRTDFIENIFETFTEFVEANINESKIDELCKRIHKEIISGTYLEKELSTSLLAEDHVMYLAKVYYELLKKDIDIESNLNIVLEQDDCYLDIVYGDLLKFGFNNRSKKRNIVVIPVNTAFDSEVTYKMHNEQLPLVSENTLHGKWLKRLEATKYNFENINLEIERSLAFQNINYSMIDRKNGNQKIYPIGSIACVETDKASYYLLAVSEFDELNMARSTKDGIVQCINYLLKFYDQFGQGYDLYLPLIGSGRSRSGLSLQNSFNIIIEAIINNASSIHGRIHIVVQKARPRKNTILKEALACIIEQELT